MDQHTRSLPDPEPHAHAGTFADTEPHANEDQDPNHRTLTDTQQDAHSQPHADQYLHVDSWTFPDVVEVSPPQGEGQTGGIEIDLAPAAAAVVGKATVTRGRRGVAPPAAAGA